MSSGSKSVTVGYKYYMGVHLILGHGPFDAILEFICGENSAWTGNITDNATIYINAPNLFGGDKREGGVVGYVDIMMGADTQMPNDYLSSVISGPQPAYLGVVSTVFRQFQWSSMNPYFKAPWWRIRRIQKGWCRGGAVWYSAKAQIGRDMNPAHILYQCLTDTEWGMGYSPNDMDDTVWRAAADQLYNEGFGMSLGWLEQTSIQEFVQLVLSHIDANIRVNVRTGLFQIKLLRQDYTAASILPRQLNPSNCRLTSFQRTAWGDTANEIVVKYKDRDEKDQSVAVQDLANIEVQLAVVSTTKEFVGIRDADLANRVAMRELNKTSTPLAKVTIVTNRIAWDWDVTDVFPLVWPRLGINGAPFRVTKINKGSLGSGEITIEAVEDIFGLPTGAYVQQQPPGWVDPISQPQAVTAGRAVEAPYWDVVHTLAAADIAYLPTDYGFGQVMAVAPTADAYGFDLWSAPSSGGVYSDVGDGDFAPTGLLLVDMPRGGSAVTFVLSGARNLDDIDIGSYCIIDNEYLGVTAVNVATSTITATRAALDTVPALHLAGSRVYFAENWIGTDVVNTHVSGETTYYKPLTRTGKGTLSLALATALSVNFTSRATRPYPQGNLQINGSYFPSAVYGALSTTWAARDRTQQTVTLTPFTTGNIGPETGTTGRVRVYNNTTLLRTYSGITTNSWTYPATDDYADGILQNLRLVFDNQRSTYTSWQNHDITIDRHGLGFHLGEELGGVAP